MSRSLAGLFIGTMSLTCTLAARGEPVVLEAGFVLTQEATGLPWPTQITFGPDGRLYVATRTGTIFAFDYGPDGVQGSGTVVASNVGGNLLGIAFDENGDFYASSNESAYDTGFLARLLDSDHDGIYETQQRFVTQLPNAGHHNDQLAIDGHILYVGQGSRTDDGEADNTQPIPAATVLRVDLLQVDFNASNNLPSVYAYGFRNPFGIGVDAQHRVWVGDNGQDTPLRPEKLHRVVPGGHHGFPQESAPPDAVPPVLELGLGTSADGLDFYPAGGCWGSGYEGNLFIARFDYELDDPNGVGMDVVRVVPDLSDADQPTGQATVFARGFLNPLDVEVDPYGHLVVMTFGPFTQADGRLFRISRLNTRSIVARHIFYNNSFYDSDSKACTTLTGANPCNDNTALATDKSALDPGQTAETSHYISYSRGINGLMIDVMSGACGPLPGGALSASNFDFKVGNSANLGSYAAAAAPLSIDVTPGGGSGGSDRVRIIWADNAIPNTRWLRVVVKSNASGGQLDLTDDSVFYFGLAIGEGLTPNGTQAIVTVTDETDARNHPHNSLRRVPVATNSTYAAANAPDARYDYDKSSTVSSTDEIIARNNPANSVNGLLLLNPAP